jgi:tRNA(His) 5'-end guanylyltransferase
VHHQSFILTAATTMKFSDLEKKMRAFETSHDLSVPPGVFMVARLDGRGFTRLTSERYPFKKPYDEHFRDLMTGTAKHLMDCCFKVLFAHTHSDEISLLIHPAEQAYNRMLRKYHSVLAGEASAALSLLLGGAASFDCRISELPSPDLVVDYFRWRSGEANRNALHSHCYWALRREGTGARAAEAMLQRMPFEKKLELLSRRGIDFDSLPAWQRRGVGLYWQAYEKPGRDPRAGAQTRTTRRRIVVDTEPPAGDAYSAFIMGLLSGPNASRAAA